MTSKEVAEYWERNAPAWTRLTRQGYDVYRDALNTPSFLAILPDVTGLCGLDIGCGEGHNTRLLGSERRARMTGVDITPSLVRAASDLDGGVYVVGDALELPFASCIFDFATAFMSLMDVPRPEEGLKEAFRVLRPGGFLQFSITHPCFFPPQRRQIRDEQRRPVAVELGGYFEETDGDVERWSFSAAAPHVRAAERPFEIPRFHRTLSFWLNAVAAAGFVLEHVSEPHADEDLARRVPVIADTAVVAYFLHVRCRKPA